MKHLDDDIIDLYLRNELSEQMQEDVSGHLELCDDCKEAFSIQHFLYTQSLAILPEKSAESFTAGVMNKIHHQPPVESTPGFFSQFLHSLFESTFQFTPQLAATCLALFVVYAQPGNQPNTDSLSENAYNEAMLGQEISDFGYSDSNFQLSAVLGVEPLLEEELS